MIYPEHLQGKVLEFCQISGIPIINGIAQGKYTEQITRFIDHTMKQERSKTRFTEELGAFGISLEVQKQFGSFTESPIEDFMYQGMIAAGLDKHCRPQFEIGTKRVDFAFPIAKLVVECDGKKYHHTDGEQIERDQKRDIYLAKKGWQVLHFEGLAIRRNIKLCIEMIESRVNPFLGKNV